VNVHTENGSLFRKYVSLRERVLTFVRPLFLVTFVSVTIVTACNGRETAEHQLIAVLSNTI
jgi:hypothetical protein